MMKRKFLILFFLCNVVVAQAQHNCELTTSLPIQADQKSIENVQKSMPFLQDITLKINFKNPENSSKEMKANACTTCPSCLSKIKKENFEDRRGHFYSTPESFYGSNEDKRRPNYNEDNYNPTKLVRVYTPNARVRVYNPNAQVRVYSPNTEVTVYPPEDLAEGHQMQAEKKPSHYRVSGYKQ